MRYAWLAGSIVGAFGLAAAGLSALRAPAMNLPDSAFRGPHAVTISETMSAGIATRVFSPASATPDRPAPLILYLPAWGSDRADNDQLLTDLASWGFLVAASDDVGQDAPSSDTTPADEAARTAPFRLANAADFAAFGELGRRRTRLAADKASRLLDALLSTAAGDAPLAIDPAAIGVVGYSHGGAAAGALLVRDHRIRAAINLDGWIIGTDAEEGPDRPQLALFAQVDTLRRPAWLAPERYWELKFFDEEISVLRRLEAGPPTSVRALAGLNHFDFSKHRMQSSRWRMWRPWRQRVLTADEIRSTINGLVVPFLQKTLGGTATPYAGAPPIPAGVVMTLSDAYGAR